VRFRNATRLLVPLALMVLLGACSSSDSNSNNPSGSPTSAPSVTESEGGQITIGSDNANDHGTKDISGQDEVSVELDDFYFEPTILQGTAGQQVKLELENEGDALHNFTLEDQSIDQDVQSGSSESVTVTLPQSGMLEFFCKYHRGQGMVGALSV
jgi:plastocyanin